MFAVALHGYVELVIVAAGYSDELRQGSCWENWLSCRMIGVAVSSQNA
jgi:hypothetical protein